MRYPESMKDDRWELIPGIWNNLKVSPLVPPDNVLMAKQATFQVAEQEFVEFHFDIHAFILFQMPEPSCGYWSCLRDEVIQLTSRAQPHGTDTWGRDSQGRRVDWSVLMCFLEQAHFLTSTGWCYGDSTSWMFLPPFPLHGIKCPNRLHITASCLCRQHWSLSATEEKPKLF